jgi:tetrahydromethanopterin S-methyltransferase subunit B
LINLPKIDFASIGSVIVVWKEKVVVIEIDEIKEKLKELIKRC